MRSKRSRKQPWLTLMSLNFCRFVFVIQILFLFGGTSLLQAALLWQYSSTDGVDTISGTFTTDGAYSDTQGVSTHNFIVTKFETFFHNGVDVAEDFLRAPIIPNDALNEFVWKQNQHPESEGVLSVELNTGLLGEGDGGNVNGRNSIITLVCVKEKPPYSLCENVIERKDEESESLIRTPRRVAGRIRT